MNQWRKDIVTWCCGKRHYFSIVFTWDLGRAEGMAKAIRANHKKVVIVAGGPAVKLVGAPWADETPDETPFDVLAMHNPCATFTTRGCPNRCEHCSVFDTDGPFRELAEWKPAPVICDNNITAASRWHFLRVIESVRGFPHVDFQGVEAENVRKFHIQAWSSLRSVRIHLGYDRAAQEFPLLKVTAALKGHIPKSNISIYVLIGFRDSPEECLERLHWVAKSGYYPCPMRYQPPKTRDKDAYVASGWTEYELGKMMRYFWKYRFHYKTAYEEFRPEGALLGGIR